LFSNSITFSIPLLLCSVNYQYYEGIALVVVSCYNSVSKEYTYYEELFMKETTDPLESLTNNKIVEWETLRSVIYIRDNGNCWVCGNFTKLYNYDCGHIIDRCKGGSSLPDNVAVMHELCNNIKPRHVSIDDAIKWRDWFRTEFKELQRTGDIDVLKKLIASYFEDRPELQDVKLLKRKVRFIPEELREAVSILSKRLGFPYSTVLHYAREIQAIKF
jgi:hypothetical protein